MSTCAHLENTVKITNVHNISLPLAVWLLHDEYDHVNEPKYISATGLMKPIRQTILAKRLAKQNQEQEMDVSSLLASSIGTAIHDSIEKAWTKDPARHLMRLGIPADVANNILVNPTPEERAAKPNALVCLMEQRAIRSIGGYKVGGKYDMILDGRLHDWKTTSVYTYIKGSKDEDYALQGGIYRWLNPAEVLDDQIYINFIFTDWQRSMTKTEGYPQLKVAEHPVTMLGYAETESWIKARLRELDRCWDLPEKELPECTDKELWRSDPSYKYYSNPETAKAGGKSSKNFTSLKDANAYMANEKGGKGIVKTVPGEVKACGFCPSFEACSQKDRYFS